MLRSLYAAVGRAYHWHDRDSWTDSDLAGYLRLPNVYVCVLRELGAVRGYFELLRHADGSLEIVYFGLLAAAHGRGLGRSLLQAAVAAAWAAGSERIWLHTCTLDHPAALPNYLARGFVKYRTEEYHVDQSDIA
ncbi:MAG: GNAT family N-acetyltransferase [Gemmatimonadaceae bacterium]